MSIIDMPIEELKKYKGSSPCPEDIDTYWDDAIAEMNALDSQPQWVEHPFPYKDVDCYDLYFTGTKGARLHAKFMKPRKTEGKLPAVLFFHGLSVASGSYTEYGCYALNGFVVASLDTRGQGGYSEDVGGVKGTTFTTPLVRGLDGEKHDLYLRDCFLDTALLAKIIMNLPYVDEKRVGVTGGSQGGGLSIACAALEPRIRKCAATYPYMSDYKRVWDMDLDVAAYEGLRYYFRQFDPLHERENAIFERLGYVDIQNLANRVKADVLMSTGLLDTIVPPSTQFAMYNKLKSKKKVELYPDFGHEAPLNGCSDRIFEFLCDLL